MVQVKPASIAIKIVADAIPNLIAPHAFEVAGRASPRGQHLHQPQHDWRGGRECSIFAHGFAWALCDDCGHDYIVAFSYKGRGVCPACNTRRRVEAAARLSDHAYPRLPVLSMPPQRTHLRGRYLASFG